MTMRSAASSQVPATTTRVTTPYTPPATAPISATTIKTSPQSSRRSTTIAPPRGSANRQNGLRISLACVSARRSIAPVDEVDLPSQEEASDQRRDDEGQRPRPHDETLAANHVRRHCDGCQPRKRDEEVLHRRVGEDVSEPSRPSQQDADQRPRQQCHCEHPNGRRAMVFCAEQLGHRRGRARGRANRRRHRPRPPEQAPHGPSGAHRPCGPSPVPPRACGRGRYPHPYRPHLR